MTVDVRPAPPGAGLHRPNLPGASLPGANLPGASLPGAILPGIDLLAAGRFKEALAPLRLALSLGNAAPATLLNLAIAEDHAGDRQCARRICRQVAAALPDWDEPVLRLAESLRAAGEHTAAEQTYRQVLELNPARPEALIALSGLLLMRGQPEPARDLLLQCCGVAPDNAEAWNTLGLALRATDAAGLALSAFIAAQRLRPDCLDYVLNGVETAVDAKNLDPGQGDAELARLSVACEQNPLNPVLQAGRGMLLERLGRRPEAIDALEAATELAPDELAPLRLLGGVLARSSRARQAVAVLRRLSALDPENPQVHNDLAAVLMRLHQHAEARTILLDVLGKIGPNTAILCNLANATTCVGLQDEAVALARRAIELDPEAVLARRALCNTLPYRDGTTGAELLAAMRDCSAALARSPQPPLANPPDPHRPLVVGLLSGTLRSHPVGWLTVAGIETLDPDQFSVICLVQNAAPEEPIARRYRVVARNWIEVDGLTDAALTTVAREHGIDILIDLGGYGDAARMAACANRLAPVQIKWVGMQAHSSGLAEMDWFITDRWETPDGFEPLYSEKLLRLDDGYVCYSPPPHSPDVVTLPALANGFVTFGCFNNLAKITPRVIETWAEILRRIPNARLVLKTHQLSDAATADGFLADFAALGIAAERIETRGSSGHRAFMGQYGDIDIVLDPFPYSGGLTTCEALWMGVPTITLPGQTFASRHSTSHLSNAGLPDWITGSVDEYIAMAVSRAADLTALATLRAGLRQQLRQSPLCDAPRFGRSLGAALRRAWQAWCADNQCC
ncbi:tetratricopeptide repeat protein [Rhodopila sp.]|uniref:tetratricopeptide repeat protein n=1 Tax=Rhodopila sp. TaxID=2480087 RepID=UPI003D14AC7D